jgi:hypothetical protein
MTPDAIASLFRQHSDDVWLVLLTISHPSMTTVRVVNNTEPIVSNGQAYSAFPFQIQLPQDAAERMATATLTISNVDRSLVDEIRTIAGRPTVSIAVIAAARPDDVEFGPLEFELSGVQWNAEAISGQLTYEPVMQQPFPAGVFDPQRFPGLFGRTEA